MALSNVRNLVRRASDAPGERLSWRAALMLIIAMSLLGWGVVAAAVALLLG
jgi:hypothetical protein